MRTLQSDVFKTFLRRPPENAGGVARRGPGVEAGCMTWVGFDELFGYGRTASVSVLIAGGFFYSQVTGEYLSFRCKIKYFCHHEFADFLFHGLVV